MMMLVHFPRRRTRGTGFTLVEVLVALAIMLAGLVAVVAAFPNMLQGERQAELLTIATALADQKAAEIRRDDDLNNKLILEIQSLTVPTDPIEFPDEPRLEYSFCGTSVLYSDVASNDPRGYPGIARVLIRYSASYRASQDVIYELPFDR